MERAGNGAASSGPAAAAGVAWGRVIGLPVTAGDLGSISDAVIGLARRAAGGLICIANVHMLVTARRDAEFRRVLDAATMVVSDGRPLVWRLRHRGLPWAQQVRGPDLMIALCAAAAAEGLPVYFYGGEESTIERLRTALRGRFPALRIAGVEAPPMLPLRPAVDRAAIERIRASGARMVFVGLGCPKQEFWMHAHAPHLGAVLLGVGQAFAIAAGELPEAPRWMQRSALEWLFRLASEPRRLWRRYLVTNSLFIAFVASETLFGPFRSGPSPPQEPQGSA